MVCGVILSGSVLVIACDPERFDYIADSPVPLPPIPTSPHIGVGHGVYYVGPPAGEEFPSEASAELFDFYIETMASRGWRLVETHRKTRAFDDWALTWENTGRLVELTFGPTEGRRKELEVQLCPPHAPGVCKLSAGA